MIGLLVGQPFISLFGAADAGKGNVEVTLVGPAGEKDVIPVKLESRGNDVVRATYTPQQNGVHKVYVEFAGMPVPKSPYLVDINPCKLYFL